MTEIYPGRYAADPHAPLALFLVGMRVHKPLRIRRWWPTFTAMSRMLLQLQADPDLGLLAATLTYTPHPLLVQYWRSLDHLQRFAHDPILSHRPAWKTFNRLTASDNDTVGLWHEAYTITPEQTSSLYRNMPRVGLAAATGHVPVSTHRPRQHEPARAAAGAPS